MLLKCCHRMWWERWYDVQAIGHSVPSLKQYAKTAPTPYGEMYHMIVSILNHYHNVQITQINCDHTASKASYSAVHHTVNNCLSVTTSVLTNVPKTFRNCSWDHEMPLILTHLDIGTLEIASSWRLRPSLVILWPIGILLPVIGICIWDAFLPSPAWITLHPGLLNVQLSSFM